jgi:hemolysin type calcium-binding protein
MRPAGRGALPVAAVATALSLLLAWLPLTARAQEACSIQGTTGPDVLLGTPADDSICGMDGADRIVGLGGADRLLGGNGDDVLEGGDGADELLGGGGADLLYGGAADDVLEGAEDTDYLEGGEGADTVSGGPAMDTCPIAAADLASSCTRSSPYDGNDANGLADVHRMLSGFVSGSPAWTFETFANFTIAGVRDHAYFLVHLDTQGDEGRELYALMRSNGSQMLASLYRDDDTFVTTLPASKPGDNRVRLSVPWGRLNVPDDRPYFRWYAQTLYVSEGCPSVCFDRIPGTGLLMRPTP